MHKFSRNDTVLALCLVVFSGMIGLTYASVPLYRMFCQATGFDGTPRRATQNLTSLSAQTIEIHFDANLGQDLPWEFRPKQVSMKLHLGENGVTSFYARNLNSQDLVGSATFNITPESAAKYFNKTQCFCFNRQPLKAGASADLGVAFYVDPAIAVDPETKHIKALTLSYTFFPAKGETQNVAALKTP
ncbi:MAG: cytochrome c oxidase assembly protein [Micropepsaceae bacterium]